jgi:hypothetical protein
MSDPSSNPFLHLLHAGLRPTAIGIIAEIIIVEICMNGGDRGLGWMLVENMFHPSRDILFILGFVFIMTSINGAALTQKRKTEIRFLEQVVLVALTFFATVLAVPISI